MGLSAIPPPPHGGGCLCGAVRYRVDAAPLATVACHCRDCQKLTGATNLLTVYFDSAAFRHERGDVASWRKRADSGREADYVRCATCGTRLWHQPLATPQWIMVAAGTLHEPDWNFDPDELASAFNDHTRAIILNTPNNPTGKVFTREELETIAALCRLDESGLSWLRQAIDAMAREGVRVLGVDRELGLAGPLHLAVELLVPADRLAVVAALGGEVHLVVHERVLEHLLVNQVR